jgi:hypothetical protein
MLQTYKNDPRCKYKFDSLDFYLHQLDFPIKNLRKVLYVVIPIRDLNICIEQYIYGTSTSQFE